MENINNEVDNVDTKIDDLTKLLDEMGIDTEKEGKSKLILWNDHVNDMIYVMVALYEICGLSDQESMKVMLEAHEKGKAIAKTGSREDMMELKKGLNKRNIEATVED